MLDLLRRSARDFLDDDCTTMAAALSYYTIFSLPPLLVLLLLLVGAIMDPQDVRGALEGQLQGLMGPAAGSQIRSIISHADRPGGALLPAILGVAALLLGATGAFAQLQAALNRAWEVAPDPNQGGFKNFVMKRVFSFGMILAVAFLLLVSLVVSAVLTSLGDRLVSYMPSGLSEPVLQVLNGVVSLALIAVLFAAMFKILPDAQVGWRDAWVGGGVTAFLFVVGKFLIGFYLGRTDPSGAYGAAGALAVMLLWIYYSSLILLYGAEFTQAWAVRRGTEIVPEAGAIRLEERAAR